MANPYAPPGVTKVPLGTVPEILRWVDDDPVRARAALGQERESDKPRQGILGALAWADAD